MCSAWCLREKRRELNPTGTAVAAAAAVLWLLTFIIDTCGSRAEGGLRAATGSDIQITTAAVVIPFPGPGRDPRRSVARINFLQSRACTNVHV